MARIIFDLILRRVESLGFWKYCKTTNFYCLGTWKYWKTNHSDNPRSWKYWKTIHSDDLGTLKYRCTLGVWTYTLGVWTYTAFFGCLNLYFECLNLYFRCLNLYFGCPDGRADGRTGGRPGGRVGWLKSIGKESILGICILKKLNIVYIIESWLFGFLQKRRAPKNDEFWSDKCPEISHMRPI